MKNLKLFLLCFALVAGLFTSCTNDENVAQDEDTQETPAITESLSRLAGQYDEQGAVMASENPTGNIVFDFCFDFVYPLNLSYNNGSTVAINSLDELVTVLINSTENLYITGVEFPFDVEVYNEDTDAIEVVTINNEDEFFDLIEDCDWDIEDECACYEEYDPVCVEVTDPNGVSFVVTYPNECYAFCDGFDESDFVDNCEDDYNNTGGYECFTLNFPVSIITDDGVTITVNSQEELDNALYNTYYFDFVYPFEVTDDEGEIEVIEDVEDLIDLLEDCFDEYDDPYEDCDCDEDEYEPICVEVDTGFGVELYVFPNACIAECEGFDPADFVECDDVEQPQECTEGDIFANLLQCDWYISSSLLVNLQVGYAEFNQDGTVEIDSDNSNETVTGTWNLSSSPAGQVFMFFTFNDAPFDAISQLDWTVLECSDEFILLSSGAEFIAMERDCE